MIKLFFVGDIIYEKNQNNDLISEELYNIISGHDIKCCNLEAPIVDEAIINTEKANKVGPSHYQKAADVEKIIEAGFNMFSIANNHIMDYGMKGLKNTINFLRGQIVIGAGINMEETYKSYVYTKDNIKVGFLSIAENGFGSCIDENKAGYAWMNHKMIEIKIKELKKECNYVIINCHAGAELFKYPIPEIKDLYKRFIDIGADIVIGHHPHVIQGYECYKNKMIFYSLGNFAFSKTKKEECKKSYCVSIELEKEKYNWKVIPVMFENGQVNLDEDNIKEIKKLSQEINSSEYISRINNFCTQMYENTYKNYYLFSFNIDRRNLLNKLKSSIKLIFNLKKDNEMLLYHNLVIETHLWICRRALKILNKL